MSQFDGISVNGKPIECFLEDKKSKEIREVKSSREHFLYHPRKLRWHERRERPGKCMQLSQSEINAKNYEANLQLAAGQPRKVIIACLLTGAEFTIEDFSQKCNGNIHAVKSALTRLLNRTVFGRYIEVYRSKDAGSRTSRNRYYLTEEGLGFDYKMALEKSMIYIPPDERIYETEEDSTPSEAEVKHEPTVEQFLEWLQDERVAAVMTDLTMKTLDTVRKKEEEENRFIEKMLDDEDKFQLMEEKREGRKQDILLQNSDAPLKSITVKSTKVGQSSTVEISLNF